MAMIYNSAPCSGKRATVPESPKRESAENPQVEQPAENIPTMVPPPRLTEMFPIFCIRCKRERERVTLIPTRREVAISKKKSKCRSASQELVSSAIYMESLLKIEVAAKNVCVTNEMLSKSTANEK